MDKDNGKSMPLSGEFPAVSTQQWEDKIREDLCGTDYDKKLVWETFEQFRVRPYYRREDLGGIEYLESLPGQFPYLRGSVSDDNSWLIRQNIRVDDPESANREASEVLSRGVTSLGFELSSSVKIEEAYIHALLNGLPLETVPVNFMLDGNFESLLPGLLSYARKNKIDPNLIRGSISMNPLGRLTTTGNYRKEMLSDFSELGECLEFASDNLPGIRVINNSGEVFHNSGASVSQELAFTLAMGNEYLVQLKGLNFSLESILHRMQFGFSVGSSYFMEIAKLRAARYLWSRILEAHSEAAKDLPAIFIQSRTSEWNQTVYDPHVNMLRGTTASMSAIMGGTDSLTVSAFDNTLTDGNPFSARVARNTQIILKEESYLDKVIDPAAGSYYIENLTDSLITATWELFLKTEEKGGYNKALIEGFIQEEVKKTAGSKMQKLSTRKKLLLGTNQYPIADEKAGINTLKESLQADSLNHELLPEELRIIEPLEMFRAGRDFEALRLKTDMHTGKQPLVFIIPLGNLNMRRTRAMFTMNFFGCAGFKVVDNIARFSNVVEGLEAARAAAADIVVLCSSDDEYPLMADDLVSGAGKDIIPVIAGYPAKHIEALKNAGIEHFIHVRSNVLEELGNYQKMLGI
ncbi:MAG TPA: methylmalonyl-CoA mutase small subunit [Bacteroides sp.]|nr:methylmalonyl-CoA mutase small subunit [Bacteroides sp.]